MNKRRGRILAVRKENALLGKKWRRIWDMDWRGKNHVRESSGGSRQYSKEYRGGKKDIHIYERERVGNMKEPKKGKKKKERK